MVGLGSSPGDVCEDGAVSAFPQTAVAFVEMAHRIVWCTVATVDPNGRPRTRILHPVWVQEGDHLLGWIATGRTPGDLIIPLAPLQ